MRNEVTLSNEKKGTVASDVYFGGIFRFPRGKNGSFYMRITSNSWTVQLQRHERVTDHGIFAVHLTSGNVYFVEADKEVEIIPVGEVVSIKVSE